MKICFLHNNYYRSSGSAIVIRRLYEAFRGTGVEFFFAGCGAPTDGGTQGIEDLSWMPAGRYAHFDLMGSATRLASPLAKFVRWLRQNRFDIIHTHHRRLASIANITSSWHRTPILFTAHNTFPWALWFWTSAPGVVSGVSPSVVNYLKSSTRASTPLLTWNPFPFSEVEPPVKDMSVSRNTAITVGRLEPVKGQINIVLAWKKLQSLGMRPRLNIFGEGHLREELEATIRSNGLQDQIQMRGFSSDLKMEFSSALFNILGSRTEGFPNVVIEAAACNTATLLTDVDGSRDTVPPNVILPNKVKFGDVDALAQSLAQWFRNPEAARKDGVAFRDFLSGRCSMEAARNTYTEIYSSLLKTHPHSSVNAKAVERSA